MAFNLVNQFINHHGTRLLVLTSFFFYPGHYILNGIQRFFGLTKVVGGVDGNFLLEISNCFWW